MCVLRRRSTVAVAQGRSTRRPCRRLTNTNLACDAAPRGHAARLRPARIPKPARNTGFSSLGSCARRRPGTVARARVAQMWLACRLGQRRCSRPAAMYLGQRSARRPASAITRRPVRTGGWRLWWRASLSVQLLQCMPGAAAPGSSGLCRLPRSASGKVRAGSGFPAHRGRPARRTGALRARQTGMLSMAGRPAWLRRATVAHAHRF
mmetsp:Transcript_51243/g.141838  ORF Transcript_51243/g.141838 Transcript_51243/m.141838 type:complete len:207 (+) Transcript_51243:158-778(+)